MRRLFSIIALALIYATVLSQPPMGRPLFAQEPELPPIPKIHTINEGETLAGLATQYEVSVDALRVANSLTDADFLFVGQRLTIPGLIGEPVPVDIVVGIGDTLEAIAHQYATTVDALVEDNHLLNRYALPAGLPLRVVSRTGSAFPNEHEPAATTVTTSADFWAQGQTVSVWVRFNQQTESPPIGRLLGPTGDIVQQLRFAPIDDQFVALVGLDAFTEPGWYTLDIRDTLETPLTMFRQALPVTAVGYGLQQIPIADDPIARAAEDALLATYFDQFSPVQRWEGVFQPPIATAVQTAPYGDSRSYAGAPVSIFHSGVDFGGIIGDPVLAPAAGTVVHIDMTTIRGNLIVIDHGLGVTTAYYHLDTVVVAEGIDVVAGQVLGGLGSTGLSTGPHLHWEVRVNGQAVDGGRWLQQVFP